MTIKNQLKTPRKLIFSLKNDNSSKHVTNTPKLLNYRSFKRLWLKALSITYLLSIDETECN